MKTRSRGGIALGLDFGHRSGLDLFSTSQNLGLFSNSTKVALTVAVLPFGNSCVDVRRVIHEEMLKFSALLFSMWDIFACNFLSVKKRFVYSIVLFTP